MAVAHLVLVRRMLAHSKHRSTAALSVALALLAVTAQLRSDPASDRDAKVEESRQRAYKEFPSLRDEKSELRRLVDAAVEKLRREQPAFFRDTDWPLRLAERSAAALKKQADAERDQKDPERVADTFIEGLKERGSVKSATRLQTVNQYGVTVVIYDLDYITEAGFRREGKYCVTLNHTPDGRYFVIDYHPWGVP